MDGSAKEQVWTGENPVGGMTHWRKGGRGGVCPGTPHTIHIRGGEEVIAIVGRARLSVCSHKTTRFVVALQYEGEETYRYLIASDLSWRTLDIVQGQTLRWLVEIFQPHYDSSKPLSLTAA